MEYLYNSGLEESEDESTVEDEIHSNDDCKFIVFLKHFENKLQVL